SLGCATPDKYYPTDAAPESGAWAAVEAAASPSPAGPNALPTRAADAPTATDQPTLLVDLASRRVTYQGTLIPTTPPHHLQRQALVALAGLAAHAGEVVTMTDLAPEMQRVALAGG